MTTCHCCVFLKGKLEIHNMNCISVSLSVCTAEVFQNASAYGRDKSTLQNIITWLKLYFRCVCIELKQRNMPCYLFYIRLELSINLYVHSVYAYMHQTLWIFVLRYSSCLRYAFQTHV